MLININLLPNEEFRYVDVDGIEKNRYLVSNMGRVVDTKYKGVEGDARLKKIPNGPNGYNQVKLSGKMYYIHRLVAYAFIPNDDLFKTEINHINEIKDDNRVVNLEWCDRSYNCNFGTRIQRTSKRVAQYNLDGELIKVWPSTAECGRNGYDQSTVAACCNNKYLHQGNNKYKNFIWKYIE